MFGDICGSPLVLFLGVNSIHFGQHEKNEDGLFHGLAGLPGPALTRFTAGAAVPVKTPDKIYS